MRPDSQPSSVGSPGEAVAGQGRQHQVECVLGGAAVRGRVGQRADGLEQLDDRAGPAVRHDQRQRVLMPRPDVDEVDLDPVDLGRELRQRVQPRLARCASRTRSPSSGRAPAASPAARPAIGPATSSLVGQRVAAMRRRRSSICSSGISIWNDRISVMVSTVDMTPPLVGEATKPARAACTSHPWNTRVCSPGLPGRTGGDRGRVRPGAAFVAGRTPMSGDFSRLPADSGRRPSTSTSRRNAKGDTMSAATQASDRRPPLPRSTFPKRSSTICANASARHVGRARSWSPTGRRVSSWRRCKRSRVTGWTSTTSGGSRRA